MTFEFRYLFRYRDLVAPTLQAHRAVLDDEGSCWWGWWKRPSEEGQLAVWEALRELTAAETVQVGLFNSGDDRVHAATIDRVIVPEADEFGAFRPVRPPDDDDKLIPKYYRDSNGSRAWMHIVSLADAPTDFFGHASFDTPPPLPQYSPNALARIAGKVILDGAELRGMDTTIWSVRPSHSDDAQERFIAASVGLSEALSSSPVQASGEWILHLTDIHYAVEPHRQQHRWSIEPTDGLGPQLADAVHAALQTEGRSVGALLVTGDLTYRGQAEEFDIARRELFRLTNGLLGLSLDHLVVVPGNHDICWSTADTYSSDHPVTAAPESATANYRAFFEDLYRFPPGTNLNMARRYVLPGGQLVDVVALNSSSLEQGPNFLAGMGRIEEHAYDAASNALGWSLNRGTSLRILALHHHVALTENLEPFEGFVKGFGIAVDAPRVLRRAGRNGVHLVIHGHKHRAFLWRVGTYELPEHTHEQWDLGPVNVLGGGSAGSTEVEGGNNFFQLLRYQEGLLEVEMYRSTSGGAFERFSTWRAKVATSGDAERISPWRAP